MLRAMLRSRSVWLALALPLPATLVACAGDEDDGQTAADTVGETHSHDDDHGDESTTAGDDDGGSSTQNPAESETSGVGESTGLGESVGDESSSTGAAAIDTWENWALPEYFEPYCIGCHPGQSTRDFNMYEVVVENVDHIRCGSAPTMLPDCDDHIEPGHLPIGEGPFPTDDERWRLVDWIDVGMPRDR
jgi:hypothetical protein